MLSEPRTIAFVTELIHIPMNHDRDRLRQLFDELSRSSGYENFTRTPTGARIERPASETQGLGTFTASHDRMQIVESKTRDSVEQFAARLESVVGAAMGALAIPLLLLERCTVRSTATPMGFSTAAAFLKERTFRIPEERLDEFQRPVNLFGFRMVFPPTQQEPYTFNVRVESYIHDPKALYLENVGDFRTPVGPQALETLGRQMRDTADFIACRICPFLSRIDLPAE